MGTFNILIMGASYGSLLAAKLLLAGHTLKLACLPAEVAVINQDGIRVRLPLKGSEDIVEVDSRRLPGKLSADVPQAIDPSEFDLAALAMQEPQYRASGVRELLDAVAKAKLPCVSIMNMPLLPYLGRVPGVDANAHRDCYTDPGVRDNVDSALMTLCGPDPQAFRPPEEKLNVLRVSLPANFKAARFVSDEHTAMLRRLATDVEAARFDTDRGTVELPVKLKVHESVFVPLAKWSMLLTGNYRCVQKDGIRSIKEAVHSNLEESRSVYNGVGQLCATLSAAQNDLVPFDKYAAAAQGLVRPSSAARALAAGATNIERVDRLVQGIALHQGMHSNVVDDVVALVDARLAANRQAA